jgi:hypothetical protein
LFDHHENGGAHLHSERQMLFHREVLSGEVFLVVLMTLDGPKNHETQLTVLHRNGSH